MAVLHAKLDGSPVGTVEDQEDKGQVDTGLEVVHKLEVGESSLEVVKGIDLMEVHNLAAEEGNLGFVEGRVVVEHILEEVRTGLVVLGTDPEVAVPSVAEDILDTVLELEERPSQDIDPAVVACFDLNLDLAAYSFNYNKFNRNRIE